MAFVQKFRKLCNTSKQPTTNHQQPTTNHSPMNCIVIYDIPSNRIRTKVADICLDYGLNRIQYSAFAGDLARTHQQELIQRAHKRLGKHEGRIFLYCVSEREWAQRLEVDQDGTANGAVAGEIAPAMPTRRKRLGAG